MGVGLREVSLSLPPSLASFPWVRDTLHGETTCLLNSHYFSGAKSDFSLLWFKLLCFTSLRLQHKETPKANFRSTLWTCWVLFSSQIPLSAFQLCGLTSKKCLVFRCFKDNYFSPAPGVWLMGRTDGSLDHSSISTPSGWAGKQPARARK